MPNGHDHTIINITVLIVIVSGLYAWISQSDSATPMGYQIIHLIAVFSIFYIFGTLFLSPDLDINSTPYKRWGIFRFLWWPYKVLFKHRGLSHHPIFGPVTIILNFALILIPVLILLLKFEVEYSIPVEVIASMVSGIVLSIETHILADRVVSKLH
jgi:uncharacterized metal-binding protein